MRTVHEQLLYHLSRVERERLSLEGLLPRCFDKVNALHYNPYTQQRWQQAVSGYERLMQPAEEAVAEKLRRRLNGSSQKVSGSDAADWVCLCFRRCCFIRKLTTIMVTAV